MLASCAHLHCSVHAHVHFTLCPTLPCPAAHMQVLGFCYSLQEDQLAYLLTEAKVGAWVWQVKLVWVCQVSREAVQAC